MSFFSRLFGKSAQAPSAEQAPVAEKEAVSPLPAEDPALQAVAEPPPAPRPGTGLRDAFKDGWYNTNAAEVFPGFSVDNSDIVLDVGCGDGTTIDFCVKLGADLIYCDIDPEKVAKVGRQIAPLVQPGQTTTGHVSDSNPLPVADATATKVVSTEVIEHVDDPAQFLSELVRVGKPGATYLLTVPAPESEKAQVGLAAESYFQKPNHIRIVENDEFKALVENAGLEVLHFQTTGFYWAVWWMFFWVADQELNQPLQPLLQNWADTWGQLMDNPRAMEVKSRLDQVLPKQQIIVARKPA